MQKSMMVERVYEGNDENISLLARTFASLCFGHEPKVRVVTLMV